SRATTTEYGQPGIIWCLPLPRRRGLFLIAQLTDRWGSRYTRSGKTIWTAQPLTADLGLLDLPP
ncbi:ATP-binding protein, partial [Streptomyces sp. SID4920]|uniref:ATP-binding protein n=1 Tax=Streptomyces sp. SID4920 TaxID=2690271 RepID=UPI0004755028